MAGSGEHFRLCWDICWQNAAAVAVDGGCVLGVVSCYRPFQHGEIVVAVVVDNTRDWHCFLLENHLLVEHIAYNTAVAVAAVVVVVADISAWDSHHLVQH